MLSLKEAARISGESKIGQIDTAELLRHRVYGLGTGDAYAPGAKVEQDAAGWERAEMALLQAQIDTQRQTIELLRNELSDVKKDRDAWRCRADQLRQWISNLADSPHPGSFAAVLQQRRIHFRQH
jgi:thioesterase domain-containing protein